MDFEDVVTKRRTIRRFQQKFIPLELLKKIVDYGRLAPQGSNVQALEYVIITSATMRQKIFTTVKWAGALPPEMREPEEGRRPMAYIVVLLNTTLKNDGFTDSGAAIENIVLGATNYGLGCCWMGAIDRNRIQSLLNLPSHHEVLYIISIGYPDEQSQLEPFQGDFKYWKTEDGRMHVPKKSLDEVILKIL